MKCRTLLVDDEALALLRLRRLLRPHRAIIEIVGEASEGEAALRQIEHLRPDLVFLDIQMPGLTGLEIAGQLQDPPYIVFCTAYDEYALEAFQAHALDYLLKPVAPERLRTAMEKLQRLTRGDYAVFREHLGRILEQVRAPARRLQVRLGDRIRFVEPSAVRFFRAADKYVEAHTETDIFLLDQSLNQLERDLPAEGFVRIHRSVLVNMNHVREIVRQTGGSYRVRLSDQTGIELSVSRQAKGRLGL